MRLLAFLTLAATAAFGQTTFPFGLRFQQGQNISVVAEGSALTLAADVVGSPVSGTLQINYRGAVGSTITINSIDLTGSLDFSISGFDSVPINMIGGQTITAGIRYAPSNANRNTARVTISYTEGRTTASFQLNLIGVAPDFVFSYTPPGGNAQPLLSGGTIAFPQTVVDATATATLLITNRGSGSGTISSVTSSGAAYALVGAPLPGTIVDSGRDVRVGIAFTPKQITASTGTVSVELFNSRPTFNLEGTGSAAQFSYEVITDNRVAVVQPDGSIAIPDALVNERSTIVVRVTNSGTADGRIPAIAASGTGISLADVPPLPVILQPGNRFSFTIAFAPTTPGRTTGRLRIGQDQFDLVSNGLGPVLTYAYLVGGVSSTIQNNGSVNFVPTSVGRNSTVQFQIGNTGTAPASVTSIGIAAANSIFELTGVAALPITLAPGATSTFTVAFAPTALGAASATLRVDAQTFTLNGTGTNPAPLPTYRFEGATGAQEPLAQPAVSLTLASAYPLALNGVLTLAFNSDVFSNDPSVQFAPGGRTVNFTIPANTTRAVFANNATTMRLQTGTVAGTITLTPSFTTDGGINLTPTRPDSLNLTIASGAPRLLNVNISAKTATGITLLISGYATSRAVTQVDLTFNPTAGQNVTTRTLTINAESGFLSYYQGTASQPFGSLFTATLPLTFSGELANTDTFTALADSIESIGVTVSNRTGRSESRSVNVR